MKRIPLLALLATLAVELLLFQAAVARHHAWVYPRGWDQVQYLGDSYQGYEYVRDHGLAAGARRMLTGFSPQGTLYSFGTLLTFALAGPSRGSALAVNLAAFLLLQGATFLAVRREARSAAAAWAALGLLLALQGPWSGQSGSAFDFRLDWMAACAYGIALAAAIAGNGFRSTRWALVFGGAVGLVLLTRSLTAVYFAAIYLAFGAVLLAQPGRRARGGRLLLSGLVAAALFGPVCWLKRHDIYAYYWAGQVSGPDSAWHDSHMGLATSLRWIFSEFLSQQLGWPALALGLGGAAALLLARRRSPPAAPAARSSGAAWTTALIFFAAPAAVLTLHSAKAPQPLSILLVPAVWIFILAWVALARAAPRRALAGLAAAVALAGSALFTRALARNPDTDGAEADAPKLNALVDYLYDRAEEGGLVHPRVAVTLLSDGVSPQALRVLGYERHHRWLDLYVMLPTGLFTTTPEVVRQQLEQSDFICLAHRVQGPPVAPFDTQLEALLPANRAWCEANRRHVGDFTALGLSVALYERGSIGRAPDGAATEFATVFGLAQRQPDRAEALPLRAPVWLSPLHLLASTRADCAYRMAATYGPLRYQASGLPPGLSLDPRSGWLRGRPAATGTFAFRITATNAVGPSARDFILQVEDSAFFGTVDLPRQAPAGTPVTIGYGAFDATGKLAFIDITDLTAGKLLDRLPADEDERQNWQGRYQATLTSPGPHTIALRFVRYDPARKDPYVFFDETRSVNLQPGGVANSGRAPWGDPMKSSYELAMERLAKSDPASAQPLTKEKKQRLADIDRVYQGKLAEREIFLKKQLDEAYAAQRADEIEKVKQQIGSERARLEEDREAEKEKVRKS